MNKAYDKVTWQNTPSTASPLNASNLNKMSDALDTIDDRVITLDGQASSASSSITALQEGKVDKVEGKGLSTEDFTTAEKTKLAGISAQANKVEITPVVMEGTTLATINIDGVDTDIKGSDIEVDSTPSSTSTNPLENKAVYELVQSILPEETAEGNPISIDDASGLNAKSALVTFAPKQSGTGDPSPSNPRPISGWDSLVLSRVGKNLIPNGTDTSKGYISGKYIADNGNTVNNSGWNVSEYFEIFPNTYYTISNTKNNTSTNVAFCFYNANKEWIEGYKYNPMPRTVISPANAKYCRCCFYMDTDTSGFHQFERGETATAYEPYNGQTHTVTFAEPVAGGSYDFVSGKLTINSVCIDLSQLTFTIAGSGDTARFQTDELTDIKLSGSNNIPVDAICSSYKVVSWAAMNNDDKVIMVQGTNSRLAIKNTAYSTAEDFMASLTSADTFCYKLATPQEISLTPADVNLLKGSNTVWTDGDTVQIKYSVSIESLIPVSTRNLTKSSPTTEPQTKETETEITEETEEK